MSSSSSNSSILPPFTKAPTSSASLDTLIPHLLASKRSLSSINYVWRANEVCASTRTALEKNAISTARTSFLRSGINSQLDVLKKVRKTTENTARQSKVEFESVVRDLDKADARLKTTLEKLRTTIVEASLRPKSEEPKTLLDFVDERNVGGLVEVIKRAIDGAGEGRREFEEGNRSFEEEVERVQRLLHGNGNGISDVVGGDGEVEDGSPIPEILHQMEDHAKEMAVNLESLVSHFDLCVTAIKHVEGGGDAASKIAGDLPEGVDIGQVAAEAPSRPISDQERIEMIRVLEEDAGQVEDVVMEIRDHIVEMEALRERVDTYTDQLAREHAGTTAAFRLLEDIGHKLPSHITQSQVFLKRWDDEKANIEDQLVDLEGLRKFYDEFLRAYDTLLIEIGRRKVLEAEMDKVVQEAMSRVEKLYEDDIEERETWKREQLHFLPGDIWPGLMNPPMRFCIAPIDESDRVPDISKSVIHRAIRRVHREL